MTVHHPGSPTRLDPQRHEERKSETIEIVAPTRRDGSWTLEIQDAEEPRRVPITSKTLVLGSHARADVRVRDKTVSGLHCELFVRDGGIVVRDLGSKNGTFVGGARVSEAWGTEGTAIVIGHSTVVCGSGTAEEEEELGEPLPGVAAGSTAMAKVAGLVRRLAKIAAPVLISGETGVGKELVARALHGEGPRRSSAFVAMNVAALPRELVESELFGHERGAFTGAVTRRIGAFTEAEGGTLFLDEIGELPIDAQPKLLRALDGYEVRRIGALGGGRRATARVVAATHVPLLEQVSTGRFRRDLYHRLEVFVVEVPPLRARPGDISPIALTILQKAEHEVGKRDLTSAALAQLTAHDWPGNVRELRNALYRAADLSRGRRWIDSSSVERALHRSRASVLTFTPEQAKEWLMTFGGNVSAAARAAGMARTTFRKLVEAERRRA